MRGSHWVRVVTLVMTCAVGLGGANQAKGQTADSRSLRSATTASAPGSAQHGTAGTAVSTVPDNYVIGPGDVLAITVWKEPELSRTMPVRPDGRISLPVIGETEAAGLTTVQLQAHIGDKLRDYVRNPQINVIVQEIKSRAFNVMGRVVKPGSFELARPTTVLDAIALAGGFRDYAHTSKIYILRRTGSGTPATLPFNYKRVIKGSHTDQNVELQAGDTVVVP